MPASRMFNAKQALEKEVKDLYCEFSVADQATATIDVTTDIVLTSVAFGSARNGTTFQLVVNAPADNPTDTVIVQFTGTAAAIVCTVTPNDGTNNSAVPVSLDEDELVELINTGAVVGKTITLTDASSRRVLQTATGGAADALTSGDNQTVTFATGSDAAFVSGVGFSSVVRTGTGAYTLTLQDPYYALRHADAIYKRSTAEDISFQISAQAVSTSSAPTIVIQALTGATPTDPNTAGIIVAKLELKNSSAP